MTTKIEPSTNNSKPGTLANIKNMMKIGSDKLKEKFTNLFSKKVISPSNKNQTTANSIKHQTNSNNTASNNVASSSNYNSSKKEDNNEAFKIEDDMDNNDLSFHINNEEDDDEEEEVKSSEQNKVPEESKRDIFNNPTIVIKNTSAVHEKMMKEIEETDISTFVHRVYLKGSLIDLEGFPAIECRKIKKKNKILSLMGFGKNKKDETLKYILILDDNFIYFIKDENNSPDKSNHKIKKVGNRYNIRLLSNVCCRLSETEKNVKIITLSFSKEEFSPTDSEKIKKEFCFEDSTEQLFISYLNLFLAKINKPIINLS